MKTLKEKGLVETQVAKGTFIVNNLGKSVQSTFEMVMQETPESAIFHLIEMRHIIEPEIAALAAIRSTDAEISGMEKEIEKMDLAASSQDRMDDFLAADYDFHMKMAKASANPFVQIVLSPVVNMMRETQKYHLFHVKGGNLRSQKNHKLIFEAIKNRDPENARKRMHEHIEQVRTDVEETDVKTK
jgi:GntR family transcriptional regulator, transcriptional repressor for pyruvate dehydrogenase complex